MIVSLLLWLLVLGLGFSVWKASPKHPNKIIESSLNSLRLETNAPTSLLVKITHSKWLKPGFLVKKMTNLQKIEKVLMLIQSPLTPKNILALKQLIWLGFVVFFWLYLWFGDVTWKNSFWLMSLFGLSFILPNLWLQIQKEKYLKQLNEEVPYFIDLLSLTLQTGLNIQQALQLVVENKSGLVAQTIKHQLRELSFGRSLEEILEQLKTSIPNPEFQHFISSIVRAKKLGVSLANTLEIQSQLIRTRRRQKAEELSRTAAVKISLPLVLFIFPALLIIYIGPGLLNLMSQT